MKLQYGDIYCECQTCGNISYWGFGIAPVPICLDENIHSSKLTNLEDTLAETVPLTFDLKG